MPVKIFLTGQPGTGKSRLVQEIIKDLGIKVGGIATPEIRKNGRIGFQIIDLMSGKSGILAAIGIAGPKVSKYGVNIKDIEEIAIKAIENAILDPKVKLIVIDELGKMEMISKQFQKTVQKVLTSRKDCLIVLHRAYVRQYRTKGKIFTLTKENREEIKNQILNLIKI
jgi:nucleoside-triphosphatase